MNATIAGYQIQDLLSESANSLVYRGRLEGELHTVILKLLRQPYPSPRQVAAFRREYELIRSLPLTGVICTFAFLFDQNLPVMVLEDFGGKSLADWLHTKRFSLAEVLQLVLQVVDCLSQVHQQQVIHKDVSLSNIVWNPQTGQIKLIDFRIATRLGHEMPALHPPTQLEGTLAYMSPEQTGRMNREVDYRTDFYSLGVVLYELLTGQLPFPTTDTLSLIHAHIAQIPTPPHELIPDIPFPLSAIVMKLLAKNAEDRYQSSSGLMADLQECQRRWTETGNVRLFPLGQRDVPEQLRLSQKLYGREQDSSSLLAAFTRVCQGARELMLVSGEAGVGKTALVRELGKSLTQQHSYFISGKCDQFQRNLPYASLVQAFRSLMRHLLTENDAQIVAWRNALTAAVGKNLPVVIDVIPELELIVGPQPAVPVLPAVEAHNRFRLAFQNFLRVFIGPGRPLILFLDDLQWADTASLSLLQLLMTTPENHYLFVICAYRDNEIIEGAPVQVMLEEIRKEGSRVGHIALGPLTLSAIQQFMSDTLYRVPDTVRPLAELLLAKTAGNPFFVNEFLKSLCRAGFLIFSVEAREWQWNIKHIRAQNITENVVQFMADRMQTFGAATQEALRLAACLGNQFNLHTLAMICEKSPTVSAIDLWPALTEGLVFPLDDAYWLSDSELKGLSEEVVIEYKFAHDHIQQAAYSLIEEPEKQFVHQRIGQFLLQQMSPEEREKNIFTIVNQLNAAQGLMLQRAERDELAELNLLAGRKAKTAAAYGPALTYLWTGLRLADETLWQRQYELALALHVETAEAAYLCGDFARMEQLIDAVGQNARSLLDTVKSYEVRLAAYSIQNRQKEGIQIGLRLLQLLQIRFPEDPNADDIVRELAETQRLLAGLTVDHLLALPAMIDPYQLASVNILFNLTHHVYTGAPELFPFIVFQIVTLSAKYGNTRYSAFGYATYGLILCGLADDIDRGYQFGQLALRLARGEHSGAEWSSTLFVVNGYIRHWKEHVKETLKPLLEAYQVGVERGDFSISGQAAFVYGFQSYWMGKELVSLEQELEKYSVAFASSKQENLLTLNRMYQQAVANLLGQSEHPCRLVGRYYDAERMFPALAANQNVNALLQINLHKLFLCYLFLDYPQCLTLIGPTEEYLNSLLGTSVIPTFYMYDSLTRLAVVAGVQGNSRERLFEKVVANQERMKHWAKHAPVNFLHKFLLVEAERARVLGKDSEAREYYDKAITLAHENEYLNEEALAYELAGRFYFDRRQNHLARYYLRDAHYAYLRWGALAKVKDLETRYPQFFPSPAKLEQSLSTAFDAQSILKASQALTSEIVLDKLLARLMRVVMENAGAQRGVLLFPRDGQFVVEAEGRSEQEEVQVLRSIPVETRDDLPLFLFRYVERTKERVLLNDAAEEPTFAADSYLVNRQPKSVLCVPLIKQDQLTGILYLENNFTTGVFTPDKLEIVNVLATEAAISIENARLYRSLEEANAQLADYSKTLELKVEERTRALEEKNRELQRANQKIIEATQRKSQFLAGMSHQLRTPMNAILGFTRLVLRRAGDALPERQRDNLVKVRESAENLLSLINQLLDLSKIEAGRMEVHSALFDVKKFIVACVETITPLVKLGVLLRCESLGEVGDACTDEDGLRQIMLNLLSNAVKCTAIGEVVVRASQEVREHNETWLVIAVIDTGSGIAPDALEKIFQEFEQLGRSNLRQEGTGLGLPIARRWAELLGGSISVQSKLGRGSTFTVSIPMIYRTSQGVLGESEGL